MAASGPIGIFDSGLGGLTVCAEIERALPQESILYLGDTARVPYGVKSPETVRRYSHEICEFLLRHQVKAIVVACNTASAVALPALQAHYSVPLLGVLEPGAAAALRETQSGEIGVIGTEATIRSQAYAQALQRVQPEISVHSQACPLFVPLVEEGWINHPVTQQVAQEYLAPWQGSGIDTVILGCTHYPLLKGVVQKVLNEILGNPVGNNVGTEQRSVPTLVDSAQETAQALKALLQKQDLLASNSAPVDRRYFATDAPQKMRELAQRFLGHTIEKVELAEIN